MFNLSDIHVLIGNVVGRSLCYVWYGEDGQDKVVYSGKLLKKKKQCVVAYWKQNVNYDDADEDFKLTKYELAADIVCTLYCCDEFLCNVYMGQFPRKWPFIYMYNYKIALHSNRNKFRTVKASIRTGRSSEQPICQAATKDAVLYNLLDQRN